MDIVAARKEVEMDLSWIKSKTAAEFLSNKSSPPLEVTVKQNMKEYLSIRGHADALSVPEAVRTLSALYTYPLTLAFGINNIFQFPVDLLSVCIIGARAEQTLPIHWWKELLYSALHIDKFNVTMIGAKLGSNNNSKSKNGADESATSSTTIEWELPITSTNSNKKKRQATITSTCLPLHQHMFHDLPDVDKHLLSHDIFVLYNPGMGSLAHKEQWKATIQLLLSTKNLYYVRR